MDNSGVDLSPFAAETKQQTLRRVIADYLAMLEEEQEEQEREQDEAVDPAGIETAEALPEALAETLLYLVLFITGDNPPRRLALHVNSDIWAWFYDTYEQNDPVWRYIRQLTDEDNPLVESKL